MEPNTVIICEDKQLAEDFTWEAVFAASPELEQYEFNPDIWSKKDLCDISVRRKHISIHPAVRPEMLELLSRTVGAYYHRPASVRYGEARNTAGETVFTVTLGAPEILVLYYSLEGNSAFAAETLAARLGVTPERLMVLHEPPKTGLAKYLRGGRSALAGEDPALLPLRAHVAEHGTLVLAFPVWAGTYPPAIGALLKQYAFQGKDVYLVACSASGNAKKAFEKLSAALAGNTVRDSLSLTSPLKHKAAAEKALAAFAEKIQG